MICKDASFIREGNEEYYTIGLESFCEQVNVDGILKDKYIRQTRREVEPEIIGEVTEDGFPEPKRKPVTYIDDEYQLRCVRRRPQLLRVRKGYLYQLPDGPAAVQS